MINCRVMSPKILCNNCNKEHWADAEHCTGCGKSFVFGKPNAWETKTYASSITMSKVKK